MKALGLKICLFLFLTALFSGRMTPLAVITGALTGTFLLWPLYRKLVWRPKPVPQRGKAPEEHPVHNATE
jgi:hypothetical protein